MFQSIKGREVKDGQLVQVYFNLHLKKFSIKDKKSGLVLGHSETVRLKNVAFKVSESGRQRVLKEKRKNVHAYVIGEYKGTEKGNEIEKAYYNPYKTSTFITSNYDELVTAKTVTCIDKQILFS